MTEIKSKETAVVFKEPPIEVLRVRCAKCLTCIRSCPYEAILYDDENKIAIDLNKCQLCGICAGVCPEYNIEIKYYNIDALVDHIKSEKEKLDSDNLVVMCRGSSPQSCEILEVLKEKNIDRFVPLRLPCVGRIPVEFYLKAFYEGIKNISIIQCDENFCRMERGSEVAQKNVMRTQEILKTLGLEEGAIEIIKNPQKAVYFTEECVGCDKCGFICPYDAIELEELATPKIVLEKCNGCGACALVCPHMAIQLRGFEYKDSSRKLEDYKAQTEGKAPSILAFCCQWSEFSALDRSQCEVSDSAQIVEVPCANGLDPTLVLGALSRGYDGVIAFICSEEDCKSKEGRDTYNSNASALLNVLKNLDLGHRFELHLTSPRDIGNFNAKLKSFVKRIGSQSK
ncbi:MAG: hydrogenase iron-sulfur subunit [Methanomassiliicoccales archaeon]|nr:MAG: hydrogenase iron-sulfur subunit [Methanomassiliicoccales archaeon]